MLILFYSSKSWQFGLPCITFLGSTVLSLQKTFYITVFCPICLDRQHRKYKLEITVWHALCDKKFNKFGPHPKRCIASAYIQWSQKVHLPFRKVGKKSESLWLKFFMKPYSSNLYRVGTNYGAEGWLRSNALLSHVICDEWNDTEVLSFTCSYNPLFNYYY